MLQNTHVYVFQRFFYRKQLSTSLVLVLARDICSPFPIKKLSCRSPVVSWTACNWTSIWQFSERFISLALTWVYDVDSTVFFAVIVLERQPALHRKDWICKLRVVGDRNWVRKLGILLEMSRLNSIFFVIVLPEIRLLLAFRRLRFQSCIYSISWCHFCFDQLRKCVSARLFVLSTASNGRSFSDVCGLPLR